MAEKRVEVKLNIVLYFPEGMKETIKKGIIKLVGSQEMDFGTWNEGKVSEKEWGKVRVDDSWTLGFCAHMAPKDVKGYPEAVKKALESINLPMGRFSSAVCVFECDNKVETVRVGME